MRFRGLSWKVFSGVALPVVAIFALAVWLHFLAVRQSLIAERFAEAERAADTLVAAYSQSPGAFPVARRTVEQSGAIVKVVDSETVPVELATIVAEARRGGSARDDAPGLGGGEVVVAQAAGPPGSAVPVIIVARNVHAVDWHSALPTPVGFAAALAALTILLLTALQERRLRRTIAQIADAARGLFAGGPDLPEAVQGPREFRLLSNALRVMRSRLASGIAANERERRTFESLLTQLREGVILAAADGNIRIMNPAAMRLLGLRPPRGVNSFNGMAVERAVPQMDLQQLLRPQTARGANANHDREERLRIDGPLGAIHLWVRASDISLPARNEGETEATPGRLVVLTDITALTQSIEMQTTFVANASHELRTPLSTIRAAVEALQGADLAREADAACRFVEVIDRQSSRLEALASDLLDLSRLEAQEAHFEPVEIVIADFLADLEEYFKQRVDAKALRYTTELRPDAPPTLYASEQLLRLAVENLIDNAVKYTPAQGTVRVRCIAVDGAVSIEIEDTGVGIAPEDQLRVFERFYQVERARSGPARGTGLGLSIVQQAVRAMGGEVTLRSRLGSGTCVSVRIPNSQPPALPLFRAAASAPRTASEA